MYQSSYTLPDFGGLVAERDTVLGVFCRFLRVF